MPRLTIADRRERALVGFADLLLRPLALRRAFRAARPDTLPQRILCVRLERIGDLLMTAPALAALKALAPSAAIDLAVGSWNREIAAALPGVDRVETLDAAWLSRPSGRGSSALALAASAARWRTRRYDLALNFEPDIRTNLVAAAAGARRTVGFASGGGGSLLDEAIDYDPREHTVDNALALVRAAMGGLPGAVDWSLRIPDARRERASALLAPFDGRLAIGVHVSGGRAIKQWPEARFRDVAERLVRDRDAAIVLTGTPAERAQLDSVRSALPPARVLDLSDADLLDAAAVVAQLDLFVTGDTGPMHLAHAVGTPIVAIFGPSEPRRYAPRGTRDTVVRIDLPCSPCNRIRVPPERCTGHTPDCLEGISTAQVLAAIDDALRQLPRRRPAQIPRLAPGQASG